MQRFDVPEQAIQAFERIHGLRVTVHDLAGSLHSSLARNRFQHTHPLCHCVKASGMERSCVALEIFQVRSQLQSFPEGRYHVCHAGLVEWVMPVFHEMELEWMVFAGVRRPGPDLEAGFRQALTRWKRSPWNTRTPRPAEVNNEEAQLILEHLRQLTARLSSWARQKQRPPPQRPAASDIMAADRPLRRRTLIRSFIESNHPYQVRLKDIAALLKVSEDRATHLIRECCGQTFREMLIDARVKTAQELLRFSGLPILQVALSSGFPEVSHFNRLFRLRTGLTPGHYRRQIQAE
jgi:AraC-like DNA-binding protein